MNEIRREKCDLFSNLFDFSRYAIRDTPIKYIIYVVNRALYRPFHPSPFPFPSILFLSPPFSRQFFFLLHPHYEIGSLRRVNYAKQFLVLILDENIIAGRVTFFLFLSTLFYIISLDMFIKHALVRNDIIK